MAFWNRDCRAQKLCAFYYPCWKLLKAKQTLANGVTLTNELSLIQFTGWLPPNIGIPSLALCEFTQVMVAVWLQLVNRLNWSVLGSMFS